MAHYITGVIYSQPTRRCADANSRKLKEFAPFQFARIRHKDLLPLHRVVERAGINKRKEALWRCRCDCGNEKIAKTRNLKAGMTKFGSLLITKFVGRDKHRDQWYEYKCDCGHAGKTRKSAISKGQKNCSKCVWDDYEEIYQGYWNRLKRGAKGRDLEFILTRKQAWDIFLKQERKCVLTGLELSLSRTWKRAQTASLDRIDNERGYTPRNVQWVHKEVNKLKGTRSNEDLIKWARLIAEHQNE